MSSAFEKLDLLTGRIEEALSRGEASDVLFWSQVFILNFGRPDAHLKKSERKFLPGVILFLERLVLSDNESLFFRFQEQMAICLREIYVSGNTSYNSFFELVLIFQVNRSTTSFTSNDYSSYPKMVHLETLSRCNAACSFCPYTELSRIKTRMSDVHIEKIRRDLQSLPNDASIVFQPFKVSEPFLENRLSNICRMFWEDHSNWNFQIITNGSVFNIKVLEGLKNLANEGMRLSIKFSINEVDPERYKMLMGLDLGRTTSTIRKIVDFFHGVANIHFSFTRVSTSAEGDRAYLQYCKNFAPSIKATLLKRNDWLGAFEGTNASHSYMGSLGCGRWSDLSITATGEIALCCMDAKADMNLGNAFEENALSLYIKKNIAFIPKSGKRTDGISPCNTCTYYQGISGSVAPYTLNELRRLNDTQ